MDSHKSKYLKYKQKYVTLKNLIGGEVCNERSICKKTGEYHYWQKQGNGTSKCKDCPCTKKD